MSFRPEGNFFEERPTDSQVAWGEKVIQEDDNRYRGSETIGHDAFMQELLPAFHGGFEDPEPTVVDFPSIEALKADLLAKGFDPNQFDFSRLDSSLQEYQE